MLLFIPVIIVLDAASVAADPVIIRWSLPLFSFTIAILSSNLLEGSTLNLTRQQILSMSCTKLEENIFFEQHTVMIWWYLYIEFYLSEYLSRPRSTKDARAIAARLWKYVFITADQENFFHKDITFVELKTLVIESPVNSLSLIEPHRSTTFSSPT